MPGPQSKYEVTLTAEQEVRLQRLSTCSMAPFATVQRAQIGLAHQASDAMPAAGLSGFTQIEEHARGAVDAMTRNERRANQSKQPGVF